MLNTRQQELYINLMQLCAKNTTGLGFYYVDQEAISQLTPEKYQGWKYRIFGNRLASWTDFQQPDALWCRGTMFLLNDKDEAQELTCLPMQKFFNLGEGDQEKTQILIKRILEEDVIISEKLDGSLMSTYINLDGKLKLKSKMSIKSEQAIAAMLFLDKHPSVEQSLRFVTKTRLLDKYHTVDLEYTAPTNRIVLGYSSEKLSMISAQNMNTVKEAHQFIAYVYHYFDVWPTEMNGFTTKTNHTKEHLKVVKDAKNIEGYIVEFNCGTRVKVKSDWYCLLHKTKDSISTPKNLYETCLDEAADDLKAMFADDQITLKLIADMENRVKQDYTYLQASCEAFYAINKHLPRKEYAIEGQKTLSSAEFGLCMALYLGKEPEYKKTLIKNFEA